MNTPSKIRVRFAPSPTGFQHIGGLRTALYNYLFARKHGGQFILRIEDTDQRRFVPGAIEDTIRFFQHFGIVPDEGPVFLHDFPESTPSLKYQGIGHRGTSGPYIQSERLLLYQENVTELLKRGSAYRCFCSPERLEELRQAQAAKKLPPAYDRKCATLSEIEIDGYLKQQLPHTVRFRIPLHRGVIEFNDIVHGHIRFDAATLDDFIILKSDGFPTYHLAHIVDDHHMEISHVLRAVEWLPSLPKHILLYEAFGWTLPKIGHLPTLLGSDGRKKLSKRDGDVSVETFEKVGYLREALINFVVLLGWNPGKGSTQEIFSLEELIRVFELEKVHKAGAIFDRKKLDWMNHMYIMKKTPTELLALVRAGHFLEEKAFYKTAPEYMQTDEYVERVIIVEQERLQTLGQIGENNQFFFTPHLHYPKERLVWKDNSLEGTREAITKARETLQTIEETQWTRDFLQTTLLEKAGEKRGDFLWPLRVALSGAERSPSPMDIAWVLGKKETLRRLEQALELLV